MPAFASSESIVEINAATGANNTSAAKHRATNPINTNLPITTSKTTTCPCGFRIYAATPPTPRWGERSINTSYIRPPRSFHDLPILVSWGMPKSGIYWGNWVVEKVRKGDILGGKETRMATINAIKEIHGEYFDRMYIALDEAARELGVDTIEWVTSSGENYDHDDYDEFNYQMGYIMSVDAKGFWRQMFRERVVQVGHGLDSIDTAELLLDFVRTAKVMGLELPTGVEIARHVRERTEHAWLGCGR
jgi:hypothetical protein